MAVTVPDWADTLLDVIGVSWPNVDEDAYRDMADALREFAEDLEDDGQLANNHVQRLLSSGHGEALDALNGHWGKVKDKHIKDIASAARTIAGALDTAAVAIEAMKGAALVQLGYLAGEVGVSLALIPVTGGLSALLGAGAIRATQEVVKRLIKEGAEEAVGYVVSALTEPAVAALENLAADLVVQLGATAMGLQDGVDLDQAKKAGADGFQEGVQGSKDAMHLASANGGGGGGGNGGGGGGGEGGPGKGFHIEHAEHDFAGTMLNGVSVGIHGKTAGKLSKAKTAHGRTRGRDSIAEVIDPVADKAMDALEKAVKTMGDHVGTTLPKTVKQISKDHKNNDDDIRARLAKERGKDAGEGGGSGGNGGGGKRGSGDNGDPGRRPMDPQPSWHGRSAGRMRHHRRDALHVDHLDDKARRRLLESEARDLADDTQKAKGSVVEGKDGLKSGCAGALIHNGVLTTHTSTQARHGQKKPEAHPVVQGVYDDIAARGEAGEILVGRGHGKCAEVALVSDRLHQLEASGTKISTLEDAKKALSGSVIHTVAVGDQFDRNGTKIGHGDYFPPCDSCTHGLPALGISLHR